MSFSKGLRYRKFDLHVHTPASDDFEDKQIAPEDIVKAAEEKGLTGIAITDHNTGAWVDKVKEAARDTGIAVFPGVEIQVFGGERGLHVLVIFDVSKDTKHVNQFLNTIEVYDKEGKPTEVSECSPGEVADKLAKYDPSAIMVLAHCHSSKGITGDIKGAIRDRIFERDRECLLGAEANESDFLNEDKKEKHKRVIDVFDGTDEQYGCKKLGVYQSSDAHSLEELGETFTYFKVDYPVNIEDIRQALVDREVRIRQSFEYSGKSTYPQINSLYITSGFLEDQKFKFHSGLNSLLGAKGTGKSLAVEFLRFALNQEPKDDELREDHDSKLKKCLKIHGEVKVEITDETGRKYIVQRTYDPPEGNPIKIFDSSDHSVKSFDIEEIFPILFLSQNEVVKLAEDKKGERQRRFIDRFFDFLSYQRRIKRLTKKIKDIDTKFASALRAHLSSKKLTQEIDTIKEKIDKLDRQIRDPAFKKFSKQEKVGRVIQSHQSFINDLENSLKDLVDEFEDIEPPNNNDNSVKENPAVKRSSDASEKALQKLVGSLQKTISDLNKIKKQVETEYRQWQAKFESVKKNYNKIVEKAGGDQIKLHQRRKNLINQQTELSKELNKHKGKANRLKSLAENRNKAIKNLKEVYKEYFIERKERCEYFTEESQGSLRVSIKESEDKTSFYENLMDLKRGTWLRDDEVETISNTISPQDFIDNILRYEWSNHKEKKYLNYISDKTELTFEKVEKLASHLLDTYEYEDILGLLYTSIPEDVPSIQYKVGDEFKPLQELSVGQKAIALLIIALTDGQFPIVIDQPEDSLDLRSIWDDVCKKLRSSKDERQFIFTTHNSSVAVASDSDKFTILTADANQGRIIHSGSINRAEIKDEVIRYLEGGEDTYDKKRGKYNK